MAKVIKGISIEIGGNATPLNKALNDVNKTSRSLQNELRTVDKLLKLDPTNVELLKQKQDILSESIATTEEKLNRLKSAEDKVAKAFEEGEIDAEQYRAFQRNILTTEQKLKDLQTELSDTATELTNLGTDAQKSKPKLDDYKKEVDDVKSAVSDLKDTAKDTVLEIGAGATAVGGVAATAIMSFDSIEGALNHIQAQTGKTNTEMDGFRTALEAIYNGNYGEDMQDIANVMASVVQYTRETDPEKIQHMTENLYTLSDTFQFDYTESLRAVKMLTDQFGISSEEAFNLIVQGAQKGLNKNGDLLDTINEYSVHYKQQGYSAEEFFNSLENGAASGTFSIDKLGDTVKEFGIRSKDTSSATVEAFELLGYSAKTSSEDIKETKEEIADLEQKLKYARMEQANFNDTTSELTKQKNADKIAEYTEQLSEAKDKLSELTKNTDGQKKSIEDLQSAFAEGGDAAREATQEVLDQLFALDDKVLQNQIGVGLFGTMWEDLGADGVKALMDISGSADSTKESMESIKEIEYDDLGNKLEGIGRIVQTEIINPTVEEFYPEIEDGIEWIAENLDGLIPIIEGVGKQVAIVWGVKKTTEFVKGIMNLISSYKTLTTATKTATEGQKLLNSAQKANVISAVITGVLTLVNAVKTYNETKWENSSLKEEINKINEYTDSFNELSDEMQSKIDEINNTELSMKVDFANIETMKERLQEIIEDGTIDESEKGEYQTIVDLLSEKVDGFETDWNSLTLEEVNGNIKITDNIDEVNQRLDDLVENWEITQAKLTFTESYSNLQTEIALKKAEIEANFDTESIEASKKEFIDYIFEKSNLSKEESKILSNEILEQKGDFDKAIDSLAKKFESGTLSSEKYENLYRDATSAYYSSTNMMFGINDFNHEATKRIKEYTDAIVESDDASKKAKTQLESLKNTADAYSAALEALNGGQVDYNELIKLSTEYGLSHEAVLSLVKDKGIKSWSDLEQKSKESSAETNNNSREVVNSITEAGDEFIRIIEEDRAKTAKTVDESLDETEQAIEDKSPDLEDTMSNTMTNTQGAAKIGGWTNIGSGFISNLISGIFSKNSDAENAGETAAQNAKTGAGNVSLFSLGNDLVSGFVNGILSGEAFGRITSAAKSVAQNAYQTIKSWLGINSPAKKTIEIGQYFGQGFSVGMQDEIKTVEKSAEQLADSSLSAMRARKRIMNTFNSSDNSNNIASSLTSKAQLQAQTASMNNISEVKQINLGGLTIQIDHFENHSEADVNTVTDQFMHSVENYVKRRDPFK